MVHERVDGGHPKLSWAGLIDSRRHFFPENASRIFIPTPEQMRCGSLLHTGEGLSQFGLNDMLACLLGLPRALVHFDRLIDESRLIVGTAQHGAVQSAWEEDLKCHVDF
jgi:hypothetical protein